MVVLYHLRHALIPGGFVGVDVFFVISGFLITAHLVGRPPRRPRDFADFWGRRIRRLLPASLLVLACTVVAVRLVGPSTQWAANAADARSAALYVVNWSLAHRAVDYLAADNAATAIQHYWSLSVEEQFYFVWPLLVGLGVLLAAVLRVRRGPVLALVLGAVVAASFAYSVADTASNPAAAYFVTPTRMWELGTGGLVALWVSHRELPVARPVPRAALAWLGLAMIAATGALYSGSTPFPGYQAALPVLGTALVILSRPDADLAGSPGRLLALRPVRFLGDISYSVYLWHWPLVVLAPDVLGHDARWPDLVGIAALTLALATLTERFVERPFRAARLVQLRRATYAGGVAAMGVVVVLASAVIVQQHRVEAQERHRLAAALRSSGPCFGAAALDPGASCPAVPYGKLLPAPDLAATDKSAAYPEVGGHNCWSYTPSFPDRRCTFGKRHAPVTVALVGNSHAGQWLPALQRVAKEEGWRVRTYLASQCAFSAISQSFDTDAHSQACLSWVKRTATEVAAAKPDLVVMANRISVRAADRPDVASSLPEYAAGYRTVFRTLLAARIPVLDIRDTPATRFQTPDCIAQHGDDYARCDSTRADWLPPDPSVSVATSLHDPLLRTVDLTDHICAGPVCHVVNGGVITYFDGSHLTATYAFTLAPYLRPALVAALGRSAAQAG